MGMVRERSEQGCRERARREVVVAWIRRLVSEVELVVVTRREWRYEPEGRRGLYEKRVLKKEFVLAEVVFLGLGVFTDEGYNFQVISAYIHRGI